MLISHRWLQEFVDFSCSPEELDQILTMLGLEVEKILRPAEALDKFVVGEVLAKEKHPNADKLSVCSVAVAPGTVNTIVCGAPNVAAGQKVPVALAGALVPNGGFRIEPRKLRGVESNGMICSKSELGFSDQSDGIWVLPPDAPVGESLAAYLGMDDVLYEISITPNRADCLSHLGVAREIAAYFRLPLKTPVAAIPPEAKEKGVRTSDLVSVRIEDAEGCRRFAGRVIRGVKVGESPRWLKDRITACGLRSVNNVVDVTNYVMLECGKPIHAFDLDLIAGKTLIIKKAADGERFTTLDGKERALDSSMTMVADAEKHTAIGGVMGGQVSEISDSTVNVLIESAYFTPSSIRRTAKKLGISSDAAYRFERGVDIESVVFAADRAAELIYAVAGGRVAEGVLDVYPEPQAPKNITIRYKRVCSIIGKDIATTEQRLCLERLGFRILRFDDEAAVVEAPSYRVDIDAEIDCIEEIARIYGYDNIEPALISRVNLSGNSVPAPYKPLSIAEEARVFLRANGFVDIVTQTMIDPASSALLTDSPVRIANPLGEELSCMRAALAPSMLKTIERNCRYGRKNLRLFEIGTVFHSVLHSRATFIPGISEELHCIAALTGNALPHKEWDSAERAVDFYDIKGALESLAEIFRLQNAEVRPLAPERRALYPLLSPNAVELVVGETSLGAAGEVSAAALKAFDLSAPVFLCECNLSAVRTQTKRAAAYRSVSPFPTVARDIAFVVDSGVEAETLRRCILAKGGEYLQSARVFDVFSGARAVETLGEGKKSVAFALEFNSSQKTLEDAEVDAAIDAIVQHARASAGAALRS